MCGLISGGSAVCLHLEWALEQAEIHNTFVMSTGDLRFTHMSSLFFIDWHITEQCKLILLSEPNKP